MQLRVLGLQRHFTRYMQRVVFIYVSTCTCLFHAFGVELKRGTAPILSLEENQSDAS